MGHIFGAHDIAFADFNRGRIAHRSGRFGGAAALIAKSIKKYEVLAYGELGPEALAELTVEDFPCIVVGDTEGNNFYEEGQKPYRKI